MADENINTSALTSAQDIVLKSGAGGDGNPEGSVVQESTSSPSDDTALAMDADNQTQKIGDSESASQDSEKDLPQETPNQEAEAMDTSPVVQYGVIASEQPSDTQEADICTAVGTESGVALDEVLGDIPNTASTTVEAEDNLAQSVLPSEEYADVGHVTPEDVEDITPADDEDITPANMEDVTPVTAADFEDIVNEPETVRTAEESGELSAEVADDEFGAGNSIEGSIEETSQVEGPESVEASRDSATEHSTPMDIEDEQSESSMGNIQLSSPVTLAPDSEFLTGDQSKQNDCAEIPTDAAPLSILVSEARTVEDVESVMDSADTGSSEVTALPQPSANDASDSLAPSEEPGVEPSASSGVEDSEHAITSPLETSAAQLAVVASSSGETTTEDINKELPAGSPVSISSVTPTDDLEHTENTTTTTTGQESAVETETSSAVEKQSKDAATSSEATAEKPKEKSDSSKSKDGVKVKSESQEKTAGKEQASKKDEKKSKPKQACVVCGKVTKCKYNIVRNGDIKHLCDDKCFKVFRANPTQYLKKKPAAAAPDNDSVIVSDSQRLCDMCKKLGSEDNMVKFGRRRFCAVSCKNQYKKEHCCYLCFKDLHGISPFCKVMVQNVGKKPLCSLTCKKTYELEAKRRLSEVTMVVDDDDDDGNDVQIVSADIPSYKSHKSSGKRGKGGSKEIFQCDVCKKVLPTVHDVTLNGKVHKLCSDACFSRFRVLNKLFLRDCAQCNMHMMTVEGELEQTMQTEGKSIPFCSPACVSAYKVKHATMVPCSWCKIKRNKYVMVENKEISGKYTFFCTLNCLSLYRVNVQATSNSSIRCDQCKKVAPAQYHLTMSDASVRNFCSYGCVMAFQGQFTRPGGSGAGSGQPTPRGEQQPNTAAQQKQVTPQRGGQQRRTGRVAAKASPAVSTSTGTDSNLPLISNVVSLAPANQTPTPSPKARAQQQLQQMRSPVTPIPPTPPAQQTLPTVHKQTSPMTQQIIVQPPAPKSVKNKALLCKPIMTTKATSCKPHSQSKGCQTDDLEPQQMKIPVPIPVPIYVPVPMGMYNFPVPYPVPIPIPIPVPCFIPTTKKNSDKILKHIQEIVERIPSDPLEAELLAMAEAVAQTPDSDSDDSGEDETEEFAAPADVPTVPLDPALAAGAGGEPGEDMLQMALRIASEMPGEQVLDLETSINPTTINPEMVPAPQSLDTSSDRMSRDASLSPPTPSRRGRKRRGGSSSTSRSPAKGAKRGRKDTTEAKMEATTSAAVVPAAPPAPPPDANYVLKFTYGVNAFRHWTGQKNSALQKSALEKGSKKQPKLFRSDLLACSADELNLALTLFVKEVRKPNGEVYAPDSIFYLCLGIQQYLFENNRIDNIFTDIYFEQFTDKLNEVLHNYEVRLNHHGLIVCRIEEEHLWEAKQLGAHSPHVLLNSLIYFNTKFFMLKTCEDHLGLNSASITKHWRKTNPLGKPGRMMFLRYTPPAEPGSKRGKSKEEPLSFEQGENLENPLRCPVKLFEFFLSKCPESMRHRNDGFYLMPESSCVPDSPVWYSTSPLQLEPMTKMLNRVRVVKEIQEAHLHYQPPYM